MTFVDEPDLVPGGAVDLRAERRNVITMAIPVVITTSSRALMDIADFVMITWLNVDAAQAAILPAQMIMWSYIVLGMGVVSMVNTFASQALGRQRFQDCSAYAWQSFYIAALVGALGLAARPWLPQLISLSRHDPAVQAMELAYARVALLTVAPTLTSNGLALFFIGVHRPWVAMWSAVEANVVNVVISAVLMFGYLGWEPMGIAGAAWGTFVALCYRTLRLAVTMLSASMHRSYQSRTQWPPSWSKIRDLVRVGLPCGLHWISEVVVWAVFVNVLIGTNFGTAHLIATNAAWQYMRLAFMPAMGVGQALTALVGRSIGAASADRAMREARHAVVLTLVYMGSLSLVYAVSGGRLIGAFNDDPEVVRIGAGIMICAAVFQLFDAIGIVYHSALRGAGDTFVPSVVFIAASWIIILGGGWGAATVVPQWGSLGPWTAASGFIASTSVFLWWRWRSRAWMTVDLFAVQPRPPAGKGRGLLSDTAVSTATGGGD